MEGRIQGGHNYEPLVGSFIYRVQVALGLFRWAHQSIILNGQFSKSRVPFPFIGPKIVRHPSKKDPKGDPNVDNYKP